MAKRRKKRKISLRLRHKRKQQQLIVYQNDNGMWFARYEWGKSVSKDVLRAIYLALRRRLTTNRPAPSSIRNTPHYGEWYGIVQHVRRDEIARHNHMIMYKNGEQDEQRELE